MIAYVGIETVRARYLYIKRSCALLIGQGVASTEEATPANGTNELLT